MEFHSAARPPRCTHSSCVANEHRSYAMLNRQAVQTHTSRLPPNCNRKQFFWATPWFRGLDVGKIVDSSTPAGYSEPTVHPFTTSVLRRPGLACFAFPYIKASEPNRECGFDVRGPQLQWASWLRVSFAVWKLSKAWSKAIPDCTDNRM